MLGAVLTLSSFLLIAANHTDKCRARNGITLNKEDFYRHTCVLCYTYLHESSFKPSRKLRVDRKEDPNQLLSENNTVIAELSSSEVVSSFLDEHGQEKWQRCCEDAVSCCEDMTSTLPLNNTDWCPRTWDGWQCWSDSPPATDQHRPCPGHFYIRRSSDCPKVAMKRCEDGGRWFRNSKADEWTNYSLCNSVDEFWQREVVSIVAHAISIAAIIPSLFIFQMFRQLHGHRVTLHKHLLASLALHALLEIVFKTSVFMREFQHPTTSYIAQNALWCKLLVLLMKYFRLSNYLWMFCEGFYLHKLISAAFATEGSLARFYVIGWGGPVLPVAVYALLRVLYADSGCWVLPIEQYEWVLYTPCLCSLLVNCVFLVNIIRILVMKLRTHGPADPTQYRKTVRATLLLVPLFGLHFLFTLYRPRSHTLHCSWVQAYILVDRVLDGLQGALVALLYCYTNREVHAVLRRSLRNAIASHIVGPSSTHTCNSL